MTYLMNLLADRKMLLDNIAYQLFLDVVNFYSCQDTKLMRYNDVTKKFQFIGKKLFHSKFIHFLLGYKHMGAFVEKMNAEKCLDMSRYELDPSTTKINFAVPSKSAEKYITKTKRYSPLEIRILCLIVLYNMHKIKRTESNFYQLA